jgi:hypothetical protein
MVMKTYPHEEKHLLTAEEILKYKTSSSVGLIGLMSGLITANASAR